VGLGSFGVRVATMLKDAGHAVAVIERDEDNRYLSAAEAARIPVIIGDATLPTTLGAARADRARAVAVLTEDDMVNIETGLVLRQLTGSSPRTPIVLRIYDKALGAAVGRRLDFNHVRSTVDLATPWFIGAAMGLDVLGTFSVGQQSFMAGGVLLALTVMIGLYVQDVLGYSALQAGVGFIPFALALGLGNVCTAQLAPYIAPRWLIIAL
jgi:hypothetical protein